MDIHVAKNETEVMIALDGRLDTTSAPELEKCLAEEWNGVGNLVFDFMKLRYVSSAGLRTLLSTQKKINKQGGTMVVRHVNAAVMDVFDATGFTDILTVEKDDK
jgi:anti-sigma B factor antagonist